MQDHTGAERPERREPKRADFDRYASYEDEDGTVICDRRNAAAWLRIADPVSVER